jgi:hypothetical protein
MMPDSVDTRSFHDLLSTSWVDSPELTDPKMLDEESDTNVVDIKPSAAAKENTETNKAVLEVFRNK